jgi:RimJ/RimL family protein N-acetyltransferase
MTGSSRDVVHRLSAYRQRYGANGALWKALDVVLRKVFLASVYAVVWLDRESLAAMAPPDPRFTFRFLAADELAAFAQDPIYYIDSALVVGVRSESERCFAALEGDRLIAFACYTLGPVPPEQAAGTALAFPRDVAYLSYCFTLPEFRGARLNGLVMRLALQELAQRSVTKVVAIVGWTNWASLRCCRRLGYRDVGHMLTIGGRTRAIGVYPKRAGELGVRFGHQAASRDGQSGSCAASLDAAMRGPLPTAER